MKKTESIFLEGGEHAVLLLHGLSSTPLELRYLAKALHQAGFTVLVPDMPGYSSGSEEKPMQEWINEGVKAFDKLKRKYSMVSVGGLSMGATLSAAVVQQRPVAQALLLLSITLNYDGWTIPRYHFLLNWLYFTPLRYRWRYHESAPYGLKNEALRKRIARSMEKDSLSEIGPSTISLPAIYQANKLTKYVKKHITEIKNDCLMIHAIDDDTASPLNALFVREHIQSPVKRLIMLDDSYHMITSDNERETVAREAIMFLQESAQYHHPSNTGDEPRVASRALARKLRKTGTMTSLKKNQRTK